MTRLDSAEVCYDLTVSFTLAFQMDESRRQGAPWLARTWRGLRELGRGIVARTRGFAGAALALVSLLAVAWTAVVILRQPPARALEIERGTVREHARRRRGDRLYARLLKRLGKAGNRESRRFKPRRVCRRRS